MVAVQPTQGTIVTQTATIIAAIVYDIFLNTIQVKIENDGDNWTLRYKIQMMTMAMEFTIGQEFEENNPLLGETIKVRIFLKT